MYVVHPIHLVPNMYPLVIYSLCLLKITHNVDKSTNLDLQLHFSISQIQENATNPAYNIIPAVILAHDGSTPTPPGRGESLIGNEAVK